MENQFRYTGKEALEMVQIHFPNDWKEKIEEGKQTIRSMMRVYKSTAEQAYNRFVNSGASIPSTVVYLASLHSLLQEDKLKEKTISEKIRELQQLQQDIINQALALEKSNITSEIDKQILRGFYSTKQASISKELDDITYSIDVVEPCFVLVQTNLFANQ